MASIHWVCCVTVLFAVWELTLSRSCPAGNLQIDSKGLDVILLIDKSNSVQKKFGIMKEFLIELVKELKVEENNIRIAAISFFMDSTIEFRLRDGTTTKDIIKEIQNIEFIEPTVSNPKTFLSKSMEEAHKEQFKSSNGGRSKSKKIIIVLFDGQIKDNETAIAEAGKAKERGIQIFSLGVNVKSDKQENIVRAVSSKPQTKGVNYFLSLSFDKLRDSELGNVIDSIKCKKDNELLVLARDAKLALAKFFKYNVGPKEDLTSTFDDMQFTKEQLQYIIRLYEILADSPNRKRQKRKAIQVDMSEMDLKKILADNPRLKALESKVFPAKHWDMPVEVYINNDDLKLLQQVKDHFDTGTCITLIPVTKEPERTDSIIVVNKETSDCNSHVGFQQNKPQLEMFFSMKQCIPNFGVLIHEIGHALGLYHEHSSPNRRNMVKVDMSIVNKPHNFVYFHELMMNTHGIPYDVTSIMHYPAGSTEFSGDIQAIFPVDKRHTNSLGQRTGLSFYDKKILHRMYCKDKCTKKCDRGGFVRHDKCECVCPDGLGGSDCNSVQQNSDGCSEEQDVTVDDTEKCISSPNYENGGEYNDGTGCNWWLKAKEGKHIRMKFKGNHFSVYCEDKRHYGFAICNHWVEIKHSGTFESPGIRFCCKTNTNEFEEVISERNEAVVTFRSDLDASNFSRKGFKLCFVAVDKGPEAVNYCDSNPCKRNSRCENKQNENTYECHCKDGTTGDLCETDICESGDCSTATTTTRPTCSPPFVPNKRQFCTIPTCNNQNPSKKKCDQLPDCVCPGAKVLSNDKCVKKRTCKCKDDSNIIKQENDIWMSSNCKIKSTCHKHGRVQTKRVKCRKCNKQRCFDELCANKKTSVYFDHENQTALYMAVDHLGSKEKKKNVLMGSGKFIIFTQPHKITMTEQTNKFMTVQYLQFNVTGASSVTVWLSVKGSQREKIKKDLTYTDWTLLAWTPTKGSSIMPQGGLKDVDFIELQFEPKSTIKVKDLLVQFCIQDN